MSYFVRIRYLQCRASRLQNNDESPIQVTDLRYAVNRDMGNMPDSGRIFMLFSKPMGARHAPNGINGNLAGKRLSPAWNKAPERKPPRHARLSAQDCSQYIRECCSPPKRRWNHLQETPSHPHAESPPRRIPRKTSMPQPESFSEALPVWSAADRDTPYPPAHECIWRHSHKSCLHNGFQ